MLLRALRASGPSRSISIVQFVWRLYDATVWRLQNSGGNELKRSGMVPIFGFFFFWKGVYIWAHYADLNKFRFGLGPWFWYMRTRKPDVWPFIIYICMCIYLCVYMHVSIMYDKFSRKPWLIVPLLWFHKGITYNQFNSFTVSCIRLLLLIQH